MPIGVLLVDDYASHVDLLRILIELDDDLEVVGTAEDGVSGAALAEELQPDLIVSDIEMPGVDGVRATALYRKVAPDAVIILTSSLDPAEAKPMAEQAGADLYIDKVTGVDTLIQLLKSAFTARRARPEVIDLLGCSADDISSGAGRD